MVKRIAALAGAGALIASAVIPALAHGQGGYGGSSGDTNVATVFNGASAMSSTGYVGLSGNGALVLGDESDVTVSGNNTVRTGDAGAYAGAVVVANVETGCCEEGDASPCGRCGGHDYGRGESEGSTMNMAFVTNDATAMSSTGFVGLSGNGALVLSGMGEDSDVGMTCHRGRRCGGGYDDEDGTAVVVTGNNLVDTGNAGSESHAWVLTNLKLMD